MKLVVQIPVFNEERTISQVIKSIPRRIPNISKVEILVVDDGSSDNTVKVAKKSGAHHILSLKKHVGLAKTFQASLQKALNLKADIIVNTDGDNQYDQKEIPKLIAPILEGRADMVIGNRRIEKLTHMPRSKKIGNIVGSFLIRKLTGAKVSDASSGFRAFTRGTARSFNLLSSHTYTHETIIQAVNKDFLITEVPITFKKRNGHSRLITGIWSHVKFSAATIIRTVLMYKAFKFLLILGLIISSLGMVGIIRFLYFVSIRQGSGHIQSLIASSVLIGMGFNIIVLGFIADLISINRKTLERKMNE